jgi:hypothetical protein
MPYVYLAGKIAERDWRHRLFPLDGVDKMTLDDPGLHRDGLTYGGPLFIKYEHTPKRQGLLYVPASRAERWAAHRANVVRRCRSWLQRSDVVFCWLDAADAYGTIYELGWADAWGKPVFLAFDSTAEVADILLREMAFPLERAHSWVAVATVEDAWHQFVQWWQHGGSSNRALWSCEVAAAFDDDRRAARPVHRVSLPVCEAYR